MRRRSERPVTRAALVLVLTLAAALLPALPAAAAREQANVVLVREGTVVTEDLYAAGAIVQVEGRVEGDLVVTALAEVRITGEVEGSVTALAPEVLVAGRVGGSVRTLARRVVVSGEVGGDVFAAAWDLGVGETADVGRDIAVWAWEADIGGRTRRNVEGTQRSARLHGLVAGDVDLTVEHLRVGDSAVIQGDLAYRSERQALVAGGATVAGSLIHRQPMPPNIRVRAIGVLVRVLGWIAVAGIGLGVLWSAPARSERAARIVRDRPVSALVWGTGLLALAPALALLTGLVVGLIPPQTGMPLLAVLAPVVVAAFSVLFVALLVAPLPVAAAVGIRLIPKRSIFAAFLAGLGVLVVASLVPWLGTVVALGVAAAGLGGWLLSGEPEG